MCKFKMRILVKIFFIALLITLGRAEENSTTTKRETDNVGNATSAETDDGSRPQRSIGKLTRLLLGGTYVMVQLGQMPPQHPLVRYPEPVHMAKGNEVLAAIPGKIGNAHISGLPNPFGSSRGFDSHPPWYQHTHEGEKAQAVDPPQASLTVSNSLSNSYYSGQAESDQQTTYPQYQAHPPGEHPSGHYEYGEPERHHAAESHRPPSTDSYDAAYSGGGGSKDSNRHDFHGSVPHTKGPAQSNSYTGDDPPWQGYDPATDQYYQSESPYPGPPPYQHLSPNHQSSQVHYPKPVQVEEGPYPQATKTSAGQTGRYATPHQGSDRGPNPFIKPDYASSFSEPEMFYEPGYAEYQNEYSFPPPQNQHRSDYFSNHFTPAFINAAGFSKPSPETPVITKILPTTPLVALPVPEEEPSLKIKHPYLLDHPLVIPPRELNRKNPPNWRPPLNMRRPNEPTNFYPQQISPQNQIRGGAPPRPQFSKPLIAFPVDDPRGSSGPHNPNPQFASSNLVATKVHLPMGIRRPPPSMNHPWPTQAVYVQSAGFTSGHSSPPTNKPPMDSHSASSSHYAQKNRPNKMNPGNPINHPPQDSHAQSTRPKQNYQTSEDKYSKPRGQQKTHPTNNKPMFSASPSESPYPSKARQPSPTRFPLRDSIPPPPMHAGVNRDRDIPRPTPANSHDDSYPRVYTHPTPENHYPSLPAKHQSSKKNLRQHPHSPTAPSPTQYSSGSHPQNQRPKSNSQKPYSSPPSKTTGWKPYRRPTNRPRDTGYKSKPKFNAKPPKYKNSNTVQKNYPKPSQPPPYKYPSQKPSHRPPHPPKSTLAPLRNPNLSGHSKVSKPAETVSAYPKYSAAPSKYPKREPSSSPHKNSEPVSYQSKHQQASSSHYNYYADPPPSEITFRKYSGSVSAYPKSSEIESPFPKYPEVASTYVKSLEIIPSYPKYTAVATHYPNNTEIVSQYPSTQENISHYPKSSEILADNKPAEASPTYYISSETLSDYYKQFEPPQAPQAMNYYPPTKYISYQSSNEFLTDTFFKKSLSSPNNATKSPVNATSTATRYLRPTTFHPKMNSTNYSNSYYSNSANNYPRSEYIPPTPKTSRRQYRKADYFSDGNNKDATTSQPAAVATIAKNLATTTLPSVSSTTVLPEITSLEDTIPSIAPIDIESESELESTTERT